MNITSIKVTGVNDKKLYITSSQGSLVGQRGDFTSLIVSPPITITSQPIPNKQYQIQAKDEEGDNILGLKFYFKEQKGTEYWFVSEKYL